MARTKTNPSKDSTATIGFEAKLWVRRQQGLGSQRDIRRALIEAELVDCMVALPGQLFYSTQIPVCLWFLAKNKAADAKRGFRDRRQQTLFIDARKLGTLIDRVHRELTNADLFATPIPKLRRRLKPRRRRENSSTPRALRGTSGSRVSTRLPSYYIRHDQTN